MRHLHRRLLLAGLSTTLAAARPLAAQAAEFRIGALFPLSGPLAWLGDECLRGLALALEHRNAGGGVGGRMLRLVRGEATDPGRAAAEARRLIGSERVHLLFGTATTSLAQAASQAAELEGVGYVELAALADSLTERGFRGFFRPGPRAASYGALTVDALEEAIAPLLGLAAPVLRIGILHDGATDAQAIAQAQEAALRGRGMTALGRFATGEGLADLTAALQRLRSAQADLLLHAAYRADPAALFRTFGEIGWRPRLVIGSGAAYALGDSGRAIGAGVEGTLCLDGTAVAVNERFAPAAGAFAELYRRRFGTEPRSGHSLAAYSGAAIALTALQQAASADRDRLRAAFLALDLPEGETAAGWGARFDEKGQNLRAGPLLWQWQEGRAVAVFPARAALAPLRAQPHPG